MLGSSCPETFADLLTAAVIPESANNSYKEFTTRKQCAVKNLLITTQEGELAIVKRILNETFISLTRGSPDMITLNLALLIPTRDAILMARSNGVFALQKPAVSKAQFLMFSTAKDFHPKFSMDNNAWFDLLDAD